MTVCCFVARSDSRRRRGGSNLTRLVVVLLWAVLAVVQIQRLAADPIPCQRDPEQCLVSNPAAGCSCNQYLNRTTGLCVECRDCCQEGRVQISACSQEGDARCSSCEPGSQFYNSATSSCRNCSVCSKNEKKVAECGAKEDTRCQPRCQSNQNYAEDLDQCFFNCELCTHGCITSDTTRCRCQPSQCYLSHDINCKNSQCTQDTTPPIDATATVADSSNELPTWGIGLISIGVVIGIVAFSAGSMILSFCTRKSPQADPENEPGVNPKPMMCTRYMGNQPGALLHKYPLFEKRGGEYGGYYSPGSLTRSGSLRSGGGRTGSIRNSPKTLGVVPPARTENATPI